jgi:hypothetical protein
MAIGIPPSYTWEFPLDTLSTAQFLAIAQEAIQQLGIYAYASLTDGYSIGKSEI